MDPEACRCLRLNQGILVPNPLKRRRLRVRFAWMSGVKLPSTVDSTREHAAVPLRAGPAKGSVARLCTGMMQWNPSQKHDSTLGILESEPVCTCSHLPMTAIKPRLTRTSSDTRNQTRMLNLSE
jgi:hypothetical protein